MKPTSRVSKYRIQWSELNSDQDFSNLRWEVIFWWVFRQYWPQEFGIFRSVFTVFSSDPFSLQTKLKCPKVRPLVEWRLYLTNLTCSFISFISVFAILFGKIDIGRVCRMTSMPKSISLPSGTLGRSSKKNSWNSFTIETY